MLFVFFAMPSEETADQCNTFLHHSLVCFESLMCFLHCAERKWQFFHRQFFHRGLCATGGTCIKTPGFSSTSPVLRTKVSEILADFLASLIFFQRQFGIYFPTNKPRFNA
jgi:hypothetical protein